MPLFLATLTQEGVTVVDGLNAALVVATDTDLAKAALNAAYPGGSTDLWGAANFQELSEVNVPQPVFLAAPIPTGGIQNNVQT